MRGPIGNVISAGERNRDGGVAMREWWRLVEMVVSYWLGFRQSLFSLVVKYA